MRRIPILPTVLAAVLVAAPALAQDCDNPPTSAAESAAMDATATRIEAAVHQQLAGYQFEPSDDPDTPQANWVKDKIYSSCTDKTTAFSVSAQWQVAPSDSNAAKGWANQAAESAGQPDPYVVPDPQAGLDPNDPDYMEKFIAKQEAAEAADDLTVVRLYADMNPMLEQSLPGDDHPELSAVDTPKGAVAAFAKAADPSDSNSQYEVFVLVGDWVKGTDDNGQPDYKAQPDGFAKPDGGNAMLLTVDGDPATVATFLKTLDTSQLGL